MKPDMSKYFAGSSDEVLDKLCNTMKTTKCDKILVEMIVRSSLQDPAKVEHIDNLIFEAFGNAYELQGEYHLNTHCFHLDDIEVRQWWDTIQSLFMNPYMTLDIRVRPEIAIIAHPGMGMPLPGNVKVYPLNWDANAAFNLLYEQNGLENIVCPNTIGHRFKIIIESESCKVKGISKESIYDKMANSMTYPSPVPSKPDMHDALNSYWGQNEESFAKDGKRAYGPSLAELQSLPAYQEFRRFQDFQNWMMFMRQQSTPQAQFDQLRGAVGYAPQTPQMTPEQEQIYNEFQAKMMATLMPQDAARGYADPFVSKFKNPATPEDVVGSHEPQVSSSAKQVPDDFQGRVFCGGDDVTRSQAFQYGQYVPPFAPGGARPMNPISDQNRATGLNINPNAPNSFMAEAMAAIHRDTPTQPTVDIIDDPNRPTDEAIELDRIKEKSMMDSHMEDLKRQMVERMQHSQEEKQAAPTKPDVQPEKVEDIPQVEEGADFFESTTEELQPGDTLAQPAQPTA